MIGTICRDSASIARSVDKSRYLRPQLSQVTNRHVRLLYILPIVRYLYTDLINTYHTLFFGPTFASVQTLHLCILKLEVPEPVVGFAMSTDWPDVPYMSFYELHVFGAS